MVDNKNPTHTLTQFFKHVRVGFVVDELKLMTISSIALMMNYL
jgi:hypothetical protein